MFLSPVRGRLLGRVGGHRRLKGTHDPRGHLRGKPSVQDHRAVILVPEGEPALAVPGVGAVGLVRPARLPIEPGELLHVRRGAVPADLEQVRLVVGGRDAGERARLGVAELALRQRFGQQRQVFECARDPDLLAGGMGVDAARPTKPVRARHRPLGGPQLAPVELGDEDEQTPGGGVNMGGEGRDRRRERVIVHAPGMVQKRQSVRFIIGKKLESGGE